MSKKRFVNDYFLKYLGLYFFKTFNLNFLILGRINKIDDDKQPVIITFSVFP